jgi:hypothetical protein
MVPALTALPCRAESDKPAAGDTVHLFILSGQSNMARLDPEKSFTPAVTRALAGDEVLVVKDAQGGEPIRRWYKKWKDAQGNAHEKTGDLYDRLMTKVTAAVGDKTPDTVTFVWMQGERDAFDKHHSEVYAAALKGLVKQLRDDLGRKDVNVVIGRISDYGMHISRSARWKRVRKAQVQVARTDPRAACVNTDDLNGPKDDLHYTPKGYEELGKRFAATAVALIKKTKK